MESKFSAMTANQVDGVISDARAVVAGADEFTSEIANYLVQEISSMPTRLGTKVAEGLEEVSVDRVSFVDFLLSRIKRCKPSPRVEYIRKDAIAPAIAAALESVAAKDKASFWGEDEVYDDGEW
jgi:hypothetical protein